MKEKDSLLLNGEEQRLVKNEIKKNICYTELVYSRINKKLNTQLSKTEIEKLIYEILNSVDENSILKKGKNYYIENRESRIRVTVNSNSFRVITVDKIR